MRRTGLWLLYGAWTAVERIAVGLSFRRSLKFSLLASVAGWPGRCQRSRRTRSTSGRSWSARPAFRRRPSRLRSSVTVVTAAEIERDQRRTVPEVLQNDSRPQRGAGRRAGRADLACSCAAPTPTTSRFWSTASTSAIPATRAALFDFGHLQTYDIERIEVLRGPQSGLYGADAIGGVIYITTKKGEGPPKVRAQVEGGIVRHVQPGGGRQRFASTASTTHSTSRICTPPDTPVTPQRLLPPGRAAIGNYLRQHHGLDAARRRRHGQPVAGLCRPLHRRQAALHRHRFPAAALRRRAVSDAEHAA